MTSVFCGFCYSFLFCFFNKEAAARLPSLEKNSFTTIAVTDESSVYAVSIEGKNIT